MTNDIRELNDGDLHRVTGGSLGSVVREVAAAAAIATHPVVKILEQNGYGSPSSGGGAVGNAAGSVPK